MPRWSCARRLALGLRREEGGKGREWSEDRVWEIEYEINGYCKYYSSGANKIGKCMNHMIQLEQQWMGIVGPQTTCSIIHPHSTCLFEIFNKCKQVVAASSKLYALLYVVMFLLRFQKMHGERKIKRTILSWSKDYIWSLLFMSWTVGGMKTALCLLNYFNSPLDGRIVPLLSGLASPSIFCLEKTRRYEVVMFTFVRSCRSAYIYFKKRSGLRLKREKEICFLIIYGMLSFLHFQRPGFLKNNQFLVNLWGDF